MIPLVKTFVPKRETLMPQLESVLYSGYLSQGEVVEKFEQELKLFLNANHCLTVNSGSSALHIALILAGVKPGDEVISTPLTAEPTNTVIAQTGARIVWADIDPETGCICPEDVEKKINKKTKAIVVVDYAGVPVDIKRFQEIEKHYGVPIVQDSAHAFGAKYDGKFLGSHFRFTAFSFQAIKHITTGDGGLLTISDEDDYKRAKLIRWFGLDKNISRQANNITVQGYKYHMNNINATIGLVQLAGAQALIDRYVANGRFFDSELNDIPGITLLNYYANSEPSYWLYTIKAENKEKLIERLTKDQITASELHKRNDKHSIFSNSSARLPALDKFEKEWLHIPCGWWVGEKEREKIVSAIRNYL